MSAYQFLHNGYLLSTDKNLLQTDVIHAFLSEKSYWAKDVPKNIVEKSLANSLCFGVYFSDTQVGFARVISDYATFAYLCDVFIVDEYRGKGLSKWLMEKIMQHPDLQNLRRFTLGTRDAHGLYRKFGFREPDNSCNNMEIRESDIYTKLKSNNAK
ncbi:MAG TPA: GNAT family N-acetyltransferase [Chitinophagales bacterium]|nr:GNAT family N-acetyltransferase [Chitinophagales bacterium]